MFFSSNTNQHLRDDILDTAGVAAACDQCNYLGLPSLIGKSKYQSYGSLKDKIWSKVNNWKTEFLSKARKEVLLKIVVQAVPTYTMSVFLLSKKFWKDIASIMSHF